MIFIKNIILTTDTFDIHIPSCLSCFTNLSYLILVFIYYLLVTEIVAQDQKYIPKSKVGDMISVYGVWVQDNELKFLVGDGWNEIHPVRYAEINGVKYGSINYNGSLFDGLKYLDRFAPLDINNPYQISNGAVMGIFTNPEDGCYILYFG